MSKQANFRNKVNIRRNSYFRLYFYKLCNYFKVYKKIPKKWVNEKNYSPKTTTLQGKIKYQEICQEYSFLRIK